MSCSNCKSNDIRELGCNTETIKDYSYGKSIATYDITFYFCMDCNNIFGKRY